MHIPDGFLSTPVWATLDLAAAPAVGYFARRAQGLEQSKVPLLGVMGAFVFAAQMINFPVGVGTSGHLVGAALLAYTLGPAAASVVLTAILVVQALVFQDGGTLALGANVLNMAVIGLLAGYLPYQIWGGGRWRRPAIFLGAMLSVMVSALLALSELLVSGVAMPATALRVSIGLFMIYGLLEGAITVAVLGALESMNVGFLRVPEASVSHRFKWVGLAAILLATFGALIASAYPDGIQRLTSEIGIGSHGRLRISTPLANYEAAFFQSGWLRKAAAGVAGVVVIYGVCTLGGRILGRQRGK